MWMGDDLLFDRKLSGSSPWSLQQLRALTLICLSLSPFSVSTLEDMFYRAYYCKIWVKSLTLMLSDLPVETIPAKASSVEVLHPFPDLSGVKPNLLTSRSGDLKITSRWWTFVTFIEDHLCLSEPSESLSLVETRTMLYQGENTEDKCSGFWLNASEMLHHRKEMLVRYGDASSVSTEASEVSLGTLAFILGFSTQLFHFSDPVFKSRPNEAQGALQHSSRSPNLYVGKELYYSNPFKLKCLCLSLSRFDQNQFDRGLRYHVLQFNDFVEFENVIFRVSCDSMVDGGDGSPMSIGYADEMLVSLFGNQATLCFMITCRVERMMAVHLLDLNVSPIDNSSLGISSQFSSCQDQERSSILSSSSLKEKITMFLYLSVRVTFSKMKRIPSPHSFSRRKSFSRLCKPTNLVAIQTVLLSCLKVGSRPKDASNFEILFVVVDCLQKSFFEMTSPSLAKEAGSNLKSPIDPKLFSFFESGAIGSSSAAKLVSLSFLCFMLFMFVLDVELLARGMSEAYSYVNV